MKRLFTVIIITMAACLSHQAMAQDDLDQFLEGSVEDGEKLIGAYIAPALKAFSLGMNQGWYNTAKPHKIAGVDLTFTGSFMKVPASEQIFDAGQLGLTNLTVVDQSGNEKSDKTMSTLLGPDNPATLSLTGTLGDTSDDFEAPSGIELGSDVKFLENKMPAAMLQLGFGLPKGTDIKLRLVPKIDLGNDSEFKLFGIGVMHDVKQHIAKSRLALLGDFDINGTDYTNPVDLNFAASGMRLTTGMRLKLAVFTFHADYTVQKYSALTAGFGINVR